MKHAAIVIFSSSVFVNSRLPLRARTAAGILDLRRGTIRLPSLLPPASTSELALSESDRDRPGGRAGLVGGVQTILFDRPLSFSTGHLNGRGRTCEPLFRNRPPSSPLLSVWPLIKWGKPFSSVHVHSFKTRFCPSYVDGRNPYCSFTVDFCDIITHTKSEDGQNRASTVETLH